MYLSLQIPFEKWCSLDIGGIAMKLFGNGPLVLMCVIIEWQNLPLVEFVKLALQKVMSLEPNPDVFPPHSVLNLVKRVSAKHIIQRHVKAKVIEESILRELSASQ